MHIGGGWPFVFPLRNNLSCVIVKIKENRVCVRVSQLVLRALCAFSVSANREGWEANKMAMFTCLCSCVSKVNLMKSNWVLLVLLRMHFSRYVRSRRVSGKLLWARANGALQPGMVFGFFFLFSLAERQMARGFGEFTPGKIILSNRDFHV